MCVRWYLPLWGAYNPKETKDTNWQILVCRESCLGTQNSEYHNAPGCPRGGNRVLKCEMRCRREEPCLVKQGTQEWGSQSKFLPGRSCWACTPLLSSFTWCGLPRGFWQELKHLSEFKADHTEFTDCILHRVASPSLNGDLGRVFPCSPENLCGKGARPGEGSPGG